MKVIASSLRKGNIVDLDGKLYVILTAENIHPGKGTPVTQIDMRRISDGVKSSQRYKTTDQVERAHVEDREYQYLYQDGDGYPLHEHGELRPGPGRPGHHRRPGSLSAAGDESDASRSTRASRSRIELPQRVTLEVVETEPVTKGQTASSSYKPAMLSNGVRTTVPPHIVAGTRIVVSTADGTYVERAKD